jgi:hypothetical protein
MTLFGWASSPVFDGTSVITVVSSVEVQRFRTVPRPGEPEPGNARPTLKRIDASTTTASTTTPASVPSWVHIPTTELWGTTLVVLRTPAAIEQPTPLCHRGGSTLWMSPSNPMVSGRNVVEAMEPNTWYLIGVHAGSENIWWDVAEWGGGSSVTLSVQRSEVALDDGLVVAAHSGTLCIERAAFYSRTYGHDDTLAYAEAREFPHEPTSEWRFDPKLVVDGFAPDRFGRHDSAPIVGDIGADRPWSGGARSRRSAITLTGPHSPSDLAVAQVRVTGPTTTSATISARTSTGEMTTVDLSCPIDTSDDSAPTVSLMATPYPTDDVD